MDKYAWQIAALFAGAALGGTYLGGYEWLRFFAYFGSWGTLGIVCASVGLGWFGYHVLIVCHRHGIRSLHDLYLHCFGESIAPTLSALTHFFLLTYAGVIASQYAGSFATGTVAWIMIVIPSLIAVFFLIGGRKRMITGASVILSTGFLLFLLIFMEQLHVPIPSLSYQLNLYWLIHAFLYLALHYLLCLVFCLPLISRIPDEGTIRWGVGLGSLSFFVLAMLGQAILLAYWHDVHASPMPIRFILSQLIPFGDWLHVLLSLFHIGIWLAILISSLALPVSVRHDLQLKPLVLVMVGTMFIVALISLIFPRSASLLATGATYCGILLLLRMYWIKRKQT
ncbi:MULTISPECIES: hypothetical protein [Brevibacillus]|uniref:hypothetical protein n=1 Tax=Brevibacillus TaxID=55080 RepID=UPI00203ACFC6|nr:MULTISPECIES: hypothetical protein [Brevibacillus]MCM3080241.1 hypothetical protein [Brevibacillus invocatus]MCM3430505.1 hypothetical protein [Brevibacillus invocatus]MDH4615858.1 hypothetical protein [Brevibacillus sp. AY1]